MLVGTQLLNRYRIDAQLGQGGMGTVYQAHDTLLGRDVAVKVINNSGLGTEGRARLLLEAQAAARLNHPNIITVYDVGEADGVPFIIMELIQGSSLRSDQKISIPEVLNLGKQVAGALAHAHQAGIIHRDLKLENVFVTPTGTAKLMDFGLARSANTPRHTQEGAIVGTFAYVAPELLMGESASPQSDLYAFGVMLYELVTGQAPFSGENLMAIISQHLHTTPVPPSTHTPQIPPRLENLILKLLAKQPGDRPASTELVFQELESITAGAAGPPQQPAQSLNRVVRGRMIARDLELREAIRTWEKAVAGESQVLLISGEPGIGKTRLVRELLTHIEMSLGLATMGECYAEGGLPYAPVAQATRQVFKHPASSTINLPPVALADLVQFIPEISASHPNLPTNPVLEPLAEQQRLFESFSMLCDDVTRKTPVLLVIDDAHWADSGTLGLVRYLARRARRVGMRFMLVLTYREVELTEGRVFNEVLADLNRERLAQRIKLVRFNAEQTRELLQVMLAEEIKTDLANHIHQETEGNPFFIEEVCKTLIEEGQLFRSNGHWQQRDTAEIRVPQSIRITIENRMDKLPPAAQDILRLAAIVGRRFTFNILRSAGDWDEDTLITGLEEAIYAQLISETNQADGGTFTFAHALIPATLIESISGLRRRRLHRRVAVALEKISPTSYEILAFQYAEAADEQQALYYYQKAAERARQVYANEDALRLLSEAIALLPPDDARQFSALAARADLNFLLGRREAQRADIDALLKLAEQLNDDQLRCDANLALADFHQLTDADLAPAQIALTLAQKTGNLERQGGALRRLARAYFTHGHLKEALDHAIQAVACFKETGNLRELAAAMQVHVIISRNLTLLKELKTDSALKVIDEFLNLALKMNDKRLEGMALRQKALAHLQVLDPQPAIAPAQKALELLRTSGDYVETVYAMREVANCHFYLNDRTRAIEILYEMLKLSSSIGFQDGISTSLSNLVETLFADLRIEECMKLLEEQLDLARTSKNPLLLMNNIRLVVGPLMYIGRAQEAMELELEALTLAEQQNIQNIQVEVFINVAFAHYLLGHPEQALAHIDRAYQFAQQYRTHFDVYRVLLNKAILVLLLKTPNFLQEAQEAINEVLQGFDPSQNPNQFLRYSVYNVLARVQFAHQDYLNALANSQLAIDLLPKLPMGIATEDALFAHSQILQVAGHLEEARAYLQKAYDRIMQVADALAFDPDMRSDFLQLPENRKITAAWQALQ